MYYVHTHDKSTLHKVLTFTRSCEDSNFTEALQTTSHDSWHRCFFFQRTVYYRLTVRLFSLSLFKPHLRSRASFLSLSASQCSIEESNAELRSGMSPSENQ